MKVEMDRLKTLSAYCAFLFLTIKLCDLILIWFKSLSESCHYCCRAAEIHSVVCSTFLLWWDWKKRLLLFLQMGSQDIKLWVFRSARIKELPSTAPEVLGVLFLLLGSVTFHQRWSSGCHKPSFFSASITLIWMLQCRVVYITLKFWWIPLGRKPEFRLA